MKERSAGFLIQSISTILKQTPVLSCIRIIQNQANQVKFILIQSHQLDQIVRSLQMVLSFIFLEGSQIKKDWMICGVLT